MAVSIRIPSVLRNLTGGQETIQVVASTIDEALAAVEAAHPGIKARLCDETGKLRRFVTSAEVGHVAARTTGLIHCAASRCLLRRIRGGRWWLLRQYYRAPESNGGRGQDGGQCSRHFRVPSAGSNQPHRLPSGAFSLCSCT